MPDRDTEQAKEESVGVWEKRIATSIVALLLTYIASVAGGVQTQLQVMQNDTQHIIKLIDAHDDLIGKHSADLRNQDNRLVRIESTIK